MDLFSPATLQSLAALESSEPPKMVPAFRVVVKNKRRAKGPVVDGREYRPPVDNLTIPAHTTKALTHGEPGADIQ
jgi:hypothetical protein